MKISNLLPVRTLFAYERKIRQIGFFLLFLTFPLLLSPVVSAAQVKLAWDPSPSPDLAGYKVYYGTTSKTYAASIDVGNVTTYTLTGLTPGQDYFIAVTAYDQSNFESDFSNEVSTASANANGLVGYWAMDEGSGATAYDSSRYGNNGVVSGEATWTTGVVAGALSFDGFSGAMGVPDVGGLASGNTPHTVAAWVKVASLPSNRAWILLLGIPRTGAHHWLLNGAGYTQLGVFNGVQVYPRLPVGQWKHLAVTFDGKALAGYVDGVLVGSAPATFDLEGLALTLGQGYIWENYFHGMVDDVRIYNRALAATEIAALAAQGGPLAGLAAYWRVDEGSGATAYDSSGLGNNGVLSGGATWTTGVVAGALNFDGYSGALTVPKVKGLAAGNAPHTIAAWVKVTSLPSNRAWILLLGNEGEGGHHWLISGSGYTQLGVWNGFQVYPRLPVGQWKHLAVTFDGTKLAGYVDGVLVGSGAATFDLEGMPLTLGQQHIWENYFHGMVDDIRIYSRALAATEIATLALTGAPGN